MIIRPNGELNLKREWLEECLEKDILPPRLKRMLIPPNKDDSWDRRFARE